MPKKWHVTPASHSSTLCVLRKEESRYPENKLKKAIFSSVPDTQSIQLLHGVPPFFQE